MNWTTILALAGGAYLFKALGLLVFGPAATSGTATEASSQAAPGQADAGLALRIGQLLPPALLAALVVSQTVVSGTQLVVDARLAGVTAGALAVWRGAPFWLVLIVAAVITAGLRALAG